MSEFCTQCATEMGFETDFSRPESENGLYYNELCEGCGPTIVNRLGECVYKNCLCKGHNVELDYGVKFYAHAPFDFEGYQLKEIEYGEYSHTITNYHLIKSIRETPCKKGDVIYVCSEGTYSAYEFV